MKGYRKLNIGEVIKDGDAWYHCIGIASVHSMYYGRQWLPHMTPCYRPIKTKKHRQPVKEYFKHLGLTDKQNEMVRKFICNRYRLRKRA